jgi:hypothetical protein
VLQSRAYASLSHSAKALLLDLAAQLRTVHGAICNNGDLTTAMGVLSRYGWKDEKTIRSAARRLESVLLISKTRQGQRPNKANLYAVTWLPLNESSKLDITARSFPFNGYKLKEPLPPLKTKVDGENLPKGVPDRGNFSLSKSANDELDGEKIPLSGTFS